MLDEMTIHPKSVKNSAANFIVYVVTLIRAQVSIEWRAPFKSDAFLSYFCSDKNFVAFPDKRVTYK